MSETPAELNVFPRALMHAFRCLQDVPLLQVLEVSKVNHRGKRQRRFLVITLTHLYSCVEQGGIQRCVETCKMKEVHTWSGEAPQVALKIPTEYDMLFLLNTGADVIAFVSALQASTKYNGANGLKVVEATGAISAADYSLERPKGLQRAAASALFWDLGSVGEVGASGLISEALHPFVSTHAEGLFVSPTGVELDGADDAAVELVSTPAAIGGAALSLPDGPLNGLHSVRCKSNGYSEEEEGADSLFFLPVSHSIETELEELKSIKNETVKVMSQHNNKNNNNFVISDGVGDNNDDDGFTAERAAWREAQETYQRERRQHMEERELWCLLLAAERRSTYRLRQAISDLQERVLALTSQNLALRMELIPKRID